MAQEIHYNDYLQLDKILNAQSPESFKKDLPAHDEMLFIIVHQTYELWFHQLHFETDSILKIMSQPALNDNSPELQTVVHRLNRMITILRVLIHQVDVMETMTPMDFLDFRDMLRPASGFQSWQFKELEAKLGLKMAHRHGKEYYISQLRKEHIDIIKKAETDKSLLQLMNNWLERMPLTLLRAAVEAMFEVPVLVIGLSGIKPPVTSKAKTCLFSCGVISSVFSCVNLAATIGLSDIY